MARGEWNAARDGQFGWLAKSAGFRRNPQEHAGTGAIRQEKTPTENGWGFVIGGGWLTTQELSISTQACQRVLGRECEVVT